MLTAARHNELVNFIMYESEEFASPKELEDEMVRRFGDATFKDLDKAMAEAADREKELAARFNADADALAEFMPLFEGEEPGALLGEVAERKAAAGDPLAIKCLAWLNEDENE